LAIGTPFSLSSSALSIGTPFALSSSAFAVCAAIQKQRWLLIFEETWESEKKIPLRAHSALSLGDIVFQRLDTNSI
jgi:hypothetical protein